MTERSGNLPAGSLTGRCMRRSTKPFLQWAGNGTEASAAMCSNWIHGNKSKD